VTISQVGTGQIGAYAATSIANKPSGVALGDYLVAHVYSDGNNVDPTLTGWAKRVQVNQPTGGPFTAYIFTKVAGGSEPSTYSAVGNSGNSVVLHVSAWRDSGGAYSTDPADVSSSGIANGADASAPSITPSQNNCAIIFAAQNFGGQFVTPPSGYTEVNDGDGVEEAFKIQTTAAATGAQSSSGGNQGTTAILFSFKPAGAGGGSVAIAGTMSAGATLTDVLDVAHSLSGSAAAGATLSDVLGVAHSLTGTAAAAAALTGAVDHVVPVSGSLAGSATLTGALDVAHALAGTATASATLAGILDHGVPLAGSASAGATLADTLDHAVPLGGVMSAGASMTASIGGVALSGQATAGATMTAGLSVTVNLSGAAQASATLADTLDHVVPLSGSAQAAATLTPALTHTVPIGGQMSASSAFTSTLAHAVPLGGLATVLAALVAAVTVAGANKYGSMTLADHAASSTSLRDYGANSTPADRAANSLTLTEV
jgi:hypothetical protein